MSTMLGKNISHFVGCYFVVMFISFSQKILSEVFILKFKTQGFAVLPGKIQVVKII